MVDILSILFSRMKLLIASFKILRHRVYFIFHFLFTPHDMSLGHDGISVFALLYLEFVTIAHVIWFHLLLIQN